MPASKESLPSTHIPFPVVIVTGLSGSGKSTALSVLEDMGFFTIDGLPAFFVLHMLEMLKHFDQDRHMGIAFGMDLRQTGFLQEFDKVLDSLRKNDFAPYILFFDAKTEVLLQRYAVTRRPHPLEKDGLGLEQSIAKERATLEKFRAKADLVLDTSAYSIHDLRRVLQRKEWRNLEQQGKDLRVHIVSFGFKYGTPSEADMVFDLRFLPNPYFVEDLRPLSGQDTAVADFVIGTEAAREYLTRLEEFLRFTLEQFEAEGRFRLTIGIGCTGGRHRSVAVAEALANSIKKSGYSLSLEHRHFSLG